MTSKQTILAFIALINAHDIDGLAALMSEDHTFIDAHGNEVSDKEKMIVCRAPKARNAKAWANGPG